MLHDNNIIFIHYCCQVNNKKSVKIGQDLEKKKVKLHRFRNSHKIMIVFLGHDHVSEE